MKRVFFLAFSLLFGFSAYGIDTPSKLEGTTVVSAKEVQELMAKGTPVFDTRIKAEFAEEHVKSSVSLPYGEKSKKEEKFDASSDSFDDSKLPAENMVFLCNGSDCWKSFKASKWAISKGKKKVYWFRGGFPEWKASGLPVEK